MKRSRNTGDHSGGAGHSGAGGSVGSSAHTHKRPRPPAASPGTGANAAAISTAPGGYEATRRARRALGAPSRPPGNGAVGPLPVLRERGDALRLLDALLEESPAGCSSPAPASGGVPNHLRRRTGAHASYRMPWALRSQPLARGLAAPPEQRPRKHRRKPSLLRAAWAAETAAALAAILTGVAEGGGAGFAQSLLRGQPEPSIAEQVASTSSAPLERSAEDAPLVAPPGIAPAPSAGGVANHPAVTASAPVRRLPTHPWLTKRCVMGRLWGHVLALRRRDAGVAAALKWRTSAAVLHDESHWLCVRLRGTEGQIVEGLGRLCDPARLEGGGGEEEEGAGAFDTTLVGDDDAYVMDDAEEEEEEVGTECAEVDGDADDEDASTPAQTTAAAFTSLASTAAALASVALLTAAAVAAAVAADITSSSTATGTDATGQTHVSSLPLLSRSQRARQRRGKAKALHSAALPPPLAPTGAPASAASLPVGSRVGLSSEPLILSTTVNGSVAITTSTPSAAAAFADNSCTRTQVAAASLSAASGATDDVTDGVILPLFRAAVTSGSVEVTFTAHAPDAFPDGAIGPVRMLWMPPGSIPHHPQVTPLAVSANGQPPPHGVGGDTYWEGNAGGEDFREVLLWVHAAAVRALMRALAAISAPSSASSSSSSSAALSLERSGESVFLSDDTLPQVSSAAASSSRLNQPSPDHPAHLSVELLQPQPCRFALLGPAAAVTAALASVGVSLPLSQPSCVVSMTYTPPLLSGGCGHGGEVASSAGGVANVTGAGSVLPNVVAPTLSSTMGGSIGGATAISGVPLAFAAPTSAASTGGTSGAHFIDDGGDGSADELFLPLSSGVDLSSAAATYTTASSSQSFGAVTSAGFKLRKGAARPNPNSLGPQQKQQFTGAETMGRHPFSTALAASPASTPVASAASSAPLSTSVGGGLSGSFPLLLISHASSASIDTTSASSPFSLPPSQVPISGAPRQSITLIVPGDRAASVWLSLVTTGCAHAVGIEEWRSVTLAEEAAAEATAVAAEPGDEEAAAEATAVAAAASPSSAHRAGRPVAHRGRAAAAASSAVAVSASSAAASGAVPHASPLPPASTGPASSEEYDDSVVLAHPTNSGAHATFTDSATLAAAVVSYATSSGHAARCAGFPADHPDTPAHALHASHTAGASISLYMGAPRSQRVGFGALRCPAPFGPDWGLLWPKAGGGDIPTTSSDSHTEAAAHVPSKADASLPPAASAALAGASEAMLRGLATVGGGGGGGAGEAIGANIASGTGVSDIAGSTALPGGCASSAAVPANEGSSPLPIPCIAPRVIRNASYAESFLSPPITSLTTVSAPSTTGSTPGVVHNAVVDSDAAATGASRDSPFTALSPLRSQTDVPTLLPVRIYVWGRGGSLASGAMLFLPEMTDLGAWLGCVSGAGGVRGGGDSNSIRSGINNDFLVGVGAAGAACKFPPSAALSAAAAAMARGSRGGGGSGLILTKSGQAAHLSAAAVGGPAVSPPSSSTSASIHRAPSSSAAAAVVVLVGGGGSASLKRGEEGPVPHWGGFIEPPGVPLSWPDSRKGTHGSTAPASPATTDGSYAGNAGPLGMDGFSISASRRSITGSDPSLRSTEDGSLSAVLLSSLVLAPALAASPPTRTLIGFTSSPSVRVERVPVLPLSVVPLPPLSVGDGGPGMRVESGHPASDYSERDRAAPLSAPGPAGTASTIAEKPHHPQQPPIGGARSRRVRHMSSNSGGGGGPGSLIDASAQFLRAQGAGPSHRPTQHYEAVGFIRAEAFAELAARALAATGGTSASSQPTFTNSSSSGRGDGSARFPSVRLMGSCAGGGGVLVPVLVRGAASAQYRPALLRHWPSA